ncbi:MAG: thiamine phosphate synthase [Burkholderiales bacterium]
MKMVKPEISGLYAITPDEADTSKLLTQVKLALEGGTRWVQYRNKSAGQKLRLQQAQALAILCRQSGAVLIINDDIKLAQACCADGVHLGLQDMAIAAARRELGTDKIIGASCYDQFPLAQRAAAEGADYIAFGSFYPSAVKPATARPAAELLRAAKTKLKLPVVAIGGVNLQNAVALIAAGADAVAVISALFGAADIKTAAGKFNNLFIP